MEVDNKIGVDICNSSTVGGRTRHVEVKMYFLRELKEQGLVKVVWKAGSEMTADIYTKNLPGPLFEKHGSIFYGEDEYYVKSEAARASRGKAKPETNFISFPRNESWRSEYYWVWRIRSLIEDGQLNYLLYCESVECC